MKSILFMKFVFQCCEESSSFIATRCLRIERQVERRVAENEERPFDARTATSPQPDAAETETEIGGARRKRGASRLSPQQRRRQVRSLAGCVSWQVLQGVARVSSKQLSL